MTKDVDWKHPSYNTYIDSWRKCRVVAEGSESVKENGTEFLPMLNDQRLSDYEAYKDRALFFEGTTRTVTGLTGLLFSKEPQVEGSEESEFLIKIAPGFVTIKTFLKNISREIISVGRLGLLVDRDTDTSSTDSPYIVEYLAEDIINWRTRRLDGKNVLSFVVLREEAENFVGFERVGIEQYRVLYLTEDNVYVQELYRRSEHNEAEFDLVEGYPLTPVISGKPITEIPFYFINVNGLQPEPSRPPLIGLVNVNISQYQNSADLEHGRHFTGLPTLWASGFPPNADQKLSIGSQVAWLSSNPQAKAGYCEFTGKGLSTLENAIKEKLDMMIVLGARMLEAPKKASESSDNQTNRKQGENSILQNISDSISEGVTEAIKFAALWANQRPELFSVRLHKDFTFIEADPLLVREWREAVQSDLLSFDSWFYNIKKIGMVPDGRDPDTELSLIDMQGNMFHEEAIEPKEPKEQSK